MKQRTQSAWMIAQEYQTLLNQRINSYCQRKDRNPAADLDEAAREIRRIENTMDIWNQLDSILSKKKGGQV
jgi:hypothetical protein